MDDSEPQKMLRASKDIHSLKRYSESGFALPLTLIRVEIQNVNKQTCKSFPRTLQIEEHSLKCPPVSSFLLLIIMITIGDVFI